MQSEAEAMTNDTEAATSSAGGGDEEEEEPQQAAGYTLDLGSAPGGDGKFRDENFYLGYDRGDNRYAEEGFAVGGRGEEMVLDLAGDENVSFVCFGLEQCCALRRVTTWMTHSG